METIANDTLNNILGHHSPQRHLSTIHLKEFNNIKVGHHIFMTIDVHYSSSRNLCLSQSRSIVILTQGAVMLHKEQMHLNLHIYNNVCLQYTPKHPIHPLQAKSKFPVLRKYFGWWPVNNLLKAYLKNSLSKWLKGQSKKLSEKGLTAGNKGDKIKRRSLWKSSPNLH